MRTPHLCLAIFLGLSTMAATRPRPAGAQVPAQIPVQAHAPASGPLRPDLARLATAREGEVHNRGVSVAREGDRTVARLDARAGEGGVLLDGVALGDGVIEVQLRGKDVAQQSFLGVAFHFVDWTTYDAVYFRPFNFRAAGAEQRAHAVQYVAHPTYTWQKLRAEHPGKYEAALEPAPDPDGWFHARIVLEDGRVEVYVNGAAQPSLVVDDLGEASSGGVALWAGNGSDGAFADLTVTPATSGFPHLTGPFLGQDPPGEEPVLFAPGVVSTGMYTRDVAMTPDGSEIYFGVLLGRFSAILETRLVDGAWTEPQVAPFSRDARFFNLEPAISPDGKRLMFLSSRVGPGREPTAGEIRSWTNQDIWVMDREGDGWSEPYNLGPPVNTGDAEFFPSLTRDGTLYFTRGSDDGRESTIWRSRMVGGRYQDPEKLGPEVNSTSSQFNAFIAPDESYLILSTAGRPDTRGGSDYYVVFRTPDDRWSDPINLGDKVNTRADAEFSPYVSPDGKHFFFMSPRPLPDEDVPPVLSLDWLRRFRAQPGSGNPAIYWMDAGFIERLRPATPGR